MAVSTEATYIIYEGNNTPGVPYPVPFRVDEEEHIIVGVRPNAAAAGESAFTLLDPSGYTVHLFEDTGNAEVITAVAYTADAEVGIWRRVPFTQTREYTVSGPFPAKSHEAALDKLTMLVQQVDEKQAATLTIRRHDGQVGNNFIPPPQPDSVPGWDANIEGTVFQFPPPLLRATVSLLNPTTLDIPDGRGALWVNTAQPVASRVRLWANYGGTLFNVILGDASP